jgi:uncharacterized protein (TIGR02145 family)
MPPRVIVLFLYISVMTYSCSVLRNDKNKHTIRDKDGNSYPVTRMADGKDWTTKNIAIDVPGSFCYDNLKINCDRYGQLYTWVTAVTVCTQLGDGWRLPTSDEWKNLAKYYGGVFDDSNDSGRAAYLALMDGGFSQFNALLGGGSDPNGGYKRIEAHGFYWTSSGSSDSTAWFGNFGKGRPAFFLQNDGEKDRAFAVRCVKDVPKHNMHKK